MSAISSSCLLPTPVTPSSSSPPSSPSPGSSSCSTTPVLKVTKKKAANALKDPSAPKRPLTSFLLFASEERPRVVAELGNISVGEVGKELGRRWALLDKDSKGKYETAHMEDKTRYEQEKENYQPSKEFLEKKAELVRKTQEVAESGVMVEYFSFLQENWRKVVGDHNEMEAKEVQEVIWQMWSKVKTKHKKVKKVRDPAEPRKPLTAFFIYQRQMRQELMKTGNVALSNKEVMGMVGERWRNLDQDLRREYEKQAEELKVDYKKEMERFKMVKSAED